MEGQAIVIPPLQTIQFQMASLCEEWDIPYLDVSTVKTGERIDILLDELQHKVILCSIEAISNSSIQDQLQSLNVAYIAIDECQVKQACTRFEFFSYFECWAILGFYYLLHEIFR